MKLMKQDVYDTILESINDGVFTVNEDFVVTSFNRSAERITGFSRGEAIGQRCFHVFRAANCQSGCFLRRTIDSGRPLTGMKVHILDRVNKEKLISISTSVLRDRAGKVIGGVETFRDLTEVEVLRREMKGQFRLDDLISKNHGMQEVFGVLPDVAASTATVLVRGETGTGKEFFARAIHRLSARKDKPFVKINCAALPDTLLESELFGHVAGAFTDAKRDREGRFAAADGGTLFLDEIGDISQAMQVRLLRVLQDKQFEPVGSSTSVQVDVRVIAATHRDLEAMIAAGSFRRDLFFRLNVVPILLPPLRERREDIPLLVEDLIEKHQVLSGKQVRGLTNEAWALLMEYDYPGNIRELEHAVEHAFVLVHGDTIKPRHLPAAIRGDRDREDAAPRSLADREREGILEALRRNRFNKVKAAEELGLSRTTLWRRMRRLGIPLEE